MDRGIELSRRQASSASTLEVHNKRDTLSLHRQATDNARGRRWPMFIAICGLALTTALSIAMLASSTSRWTFPRSTYRWILSSRATVQLVVQLLANALALVHVSVLCLLINRATRAFWSSNAVTLRAVQLWHGLCTRTVDWTIPVHMLLLLLGYILLTATPSALWAGAFTPVATVVRHRASSVVPAYSNVTFIKEWPSEIDSQGPISRSRKGHFAFAVGTQMQDSLLRSAASATTVDGSIRKHTKLDNSGFTYIGRSYGIGASVGLTDDAWMDDDLNAAYTFEEAGYDTAFNCVYNSSTDFRLELYDDFIYRATGALPNSNEAGPEDSIYLGHGASAIVAIGVGRDPTDPRRMLGIAAGRSYHHLHEVQCSAAFRPTLFNVSVSITNQNITVTPIAPIETPSNDGNLTHVLMRQFELISNDQTNLYVSLVGNSLNSSISDYAIANAESAPIALREATLPGLENAFEAMTDDMLVAYASAQLLITEDVTDVGIELQNNALRPGEDIYIYAVFAMNLVILCILAVEAIRTKFWRYVPALDYLDPAALIMASSSQAEQGEHQHHGFIDKALPVKAKVVFGSRIALHRPLSTSQGDDAIPLVS